MKYCGPRQPTRIRHRLDIYTVTKLPIDPRWVKAWLRAAHRRR